MSTLPPGLTESDCARYRRGQQETQLIYLGGLAAVGVVGGLVFGSKGAVGGVAVASYLVAGLAKTVGAGWDGGAPASAWPTPSEYLAVWERILAPPDPCAVRAL